MALTKYLHPVDPSFADGQATKEDLCALDEIAADPGPEDMPKAIAVAEGEPDSA